MDDFRLRELSFSNFRNYDTLELCHLDSLTIFVGPNAIGKTNIIEGIQMMTALESFKHPHVDELISWGRDSSRIKSHIESNQRSLDLELIIEPHKRTYSLNGKKKSATELQGTLPAVLFCPDDLMLIKGASAYKRNAFDLLGCQLSKTNRVVKRDYEKILKHKNKALKENSSYILLDSLNELLLQTGLQLYRYRIALFKNMNQRIADIYQSLTHEKECIEMSYIPSWETESIKEKAYQSPYVSSDDLNEVTRLFEEALNKRHEEEKIRQRALIGPHADKVEFFINGKNASLFGSQGQQRSLVLAWKIAEVGIIEELLGSKPLLLLDDVMSELDKSRRNALVEFLLRDIQTFITTTDTSFFEHELLDRANILQLTGENDGIFIKRT